VLSASATMQQNVSSWNTALPWEDDHHEDGREDDEDHHHHDDEDHEHTHLAYIHDFGQPASHPHRASARYCRGRLHFDFEAKLVSKPKFWCRSLS